MLRWPNVSTTCYLGLSALQRIKAMIGEAENLPASGGEQKVAEKHSYCSETNETVRTPIKFDRTFSLSSEFWKLEAQIYCLRRPEMVELSDIGQSSGHRSNQHSSTEEDRGEC